MSRISPGTTGEPLPAGTQVFRINADAKLSPAARASGRVPPEMFVSGSTERRVSVWVEELTVADQALGFLTKSPGSTVVACLAVDRIREIIPAGHFSGLDVEWEQAVALDQNSNWITNTRPGAEGHCGITGLDQGADNKTDKKLRRDLRSKLADVAELSPVPVPHEFPESVIRLEAYYIWERSGRQHGQHNENWMAAVQALRREAVQRARAQATSEH